MVFHVKKLLLVLLVILIIGASISSRSEKAYSQEGYNKQLEAMKVLLIEIKHELLNLRESCMLSLTSAQEAVFKNIERNLATINSELETISKKLENQTALTSPEIGNEGKIVYTTEENVHIINPDGTGETRLTAGWVFDWSPDGEKIAYFSENRIWVINPDGTEAQCIYEFDSPQAYYNFQVAGYQWSPTGKEIMVFGRGGLFVIESHGSSFKEILKEYISSAVFSPDGKKIAYFNNEENKVYIMNSDGSNNTEFSKGSYHGNLSWSPDGRKISYSNDQGSLVIRNIDDGNEITLSWYWYVGSNRPLIWSPDGMRVTYISPDGELLVANSDGTNKKVLYSGSYSTRPLSFSWSPNGDKITFSDEKTVYIINSDGSSLTELAKGIYPRWSPASK